MLLIAPVQLCHPLFNRPALGRSYGWYRDPYKLFSEKEKKKIKNKSQKSKALAQAIYVLFLSITLSFYGDYLRPNALLLSVILKFCDTLVTIAVHGHFLSRSPTSTIYAVFETALVHAM